METRCISDAGQMRFRDYEHFQPYLSCKEAFSSVVKVGRVESLAWSHAFPMPTLATFMEQCEGIHFHGKMVIRSDALTPPNVERLIQGKPSTSVVGLAFLIQKTVLGN